MIILTYEDAADALGLSEWWGEESAIAQAQLLKVDF